MRKLLAFAFLALSVVSAQAQDKATAIRCNAVVANNIAANGNTQVITPTTFGGTFLCGYALSSGGTAVTATLGYATAATAAVFTSLTQGWSLSTATTSFVLDDSSAFRGLYVPQGSGLFINSGTTATLGYTIYFFQERQ